MGGMGGRLSRRGGCARRGEGVLAHPCSGRLGAGIGTRPGDCMVAVLLAAIVSPMRNVNQRVRRVEQASWVVGGGRNENDAPIDLHRDSAARRSI